MNKIKGLATLFALYDKNVFQKSIDGEAFFFFKKGLAPFFIKLYYYE